MNILWFFIGFLAAWIGLGAMAIASENHDGSITLWDGFCTNLLIFPIFVLSIPVCFLIILVRKHKKKKQKKGNKDKNGT